MPSTWVNQRFCACLLTLWSRFWFLFHSNRRGLFCSAQNRWDFHECNRAKWSHDVHDSVLTTFSGVEGGVIKVCWFRDWCVCKTCPGHAQGSSEARQPIRSGFELMMCLFPQGACSLMGGTSLPSLYSFYSCAGTDLECSRCVRGAQVCLCLHIYRIFPGTVQIHCQLLEFARLLLPLKLKVSFVAVAFCTLFLLISAVYILKPWPSHKT